MRHRTPTSAHFLEDREPAPLVISRPLPCRNTFELYRRILVPGRPSFLLESGKGAPAVARYSFLGSDPYLVLSGKGNAYTLSTVDGTTTRHGDPYEALCSRLRPAARLQNPSPSPFAGGAVGYLSYDLVRRFESLPDVAEDDLHLPDLQFMFVELAAAVDHQTGMLHVMFAPSPERVAAEPREKLYREGCDRLAELDARLTVPVSESWESGPDRLVICPEQTREAYIDRVKQCQEWIKRGDIYQANLSHRFNVAFPADFSRRNPAPGPVLYDRLRRINPSPFSALLTFDDLAIVSSSPERLVRLRGRRVETRPIAGTRPRGTSPFEDHRLIKELRRNPKERAEHLMLVDLERNDLGRICRYGTVRVDEFMVIEQYSHVSHLVSNISGELHASLDGLSLLPAVFPGGTITGVPKIRCMEIIETLEPVRRALYTGSIGYISWHGDLDLNIIIRTLIATPSRGYIQVGAGIVADSNPEREFDETICKAEALLQAFQTTPKRTADVGIPQ